MITFFVRAYVTEDNAGDSYDMNFTAININRIWSDSGYSPGITAEPRGLGGDNVWFGTYVSGFAGATLGGATEAQAHTVARAGADAGTEYFLELKSLTDFCKKS